MKNYLLILFLIIPFNSFANEFSDLLIELANSDIAQFSEEAIVVDAIKNQNERHKGLSENDVIALDQQWHSEVGASNTPLITQLTTNALSNRLIEIQEMSDGLYTEIFVMDNKGLNVGQSSITSDYWQGDESKWQETFLKGMGAVHIGDIEEDESTQTLQSQVSITIIDPDTGEAIGAVTVGVNVDNF